jgi:hypothetical protein
VAKTCWFCSTIGPSKRIIASTQGANGVGAVVRAAVGDAIVDDHDLAVVAHVDPALERAGEQESDRQRDGEEDAGLGHGVPVLGADHSAAAEVVGHRPAGHAALGGALQGVDDLETVMVGEPDVEADVDVVAGGVDVGDDVVDDIVGVAEEPAAIAADRREARDRLTDADERLVTGRHVGLGLALVPPDLGVGGQPGHRPLEAGDAAAADVGLAEEHVGEHADDRGHDDDHHPSEAGGRLAVRAQQRAADEEHLERHVDGDEQPAVQGRGTPEPGGAHRAVVARVRLRL